MLPSNPAIPSHLPKKKPAQGWAHLSAVDGLNVQHSCHNSSAHLVLPDSESVQPILPYTYVHKQTGPLKLKHVQTLPETHPRLKVTRCGCCIHPRHLLRQLRAMYGYKHKFAKLHRETDKRYEKLSSFLRRCNSRGTELFPCSRYSWMQTACTAITAHGIFFSVTPHSILV